MAEEDLVEQLREMAAHRGYKLVKSRRRKVGTGDYGKFGLADARGKPVLGIGEEGLTASAKDIEDYLRGGAVSDWRESANQTPVRIEAKPPETRTKQASKSEPRPVKMSSRQSASSRPAVGGRDHHPANQDFDQLRATASSRKAELKPELIIRLATSGDRKELAPFPTGVLTGSEHLDASMLKKQHVVVARRAAIEGCCFWTVFPTPHQGVIGRVTLIVVEERARRQGIGRRLIEACLEACGSAGCATLEAMSDIEIRNFHGFYRRLGFDQTSYRFARSTPNRPK